MSEMLKPCRCRIGLVETTVLDSYPAYWTIRCGHCGAEAGAKTREAVIAEWNRRAAAPNVTP